MCSAPTRGASQVNAVTGMSLPPALPPTWFTALTYQQVLDRLRRTPCFLLLNVCKGVHTSDTHHEKAPSHVSWLPAVTAISFYKTCRR